MKSIFAAFALLSLGAQSQAAPASCPVGSKTILTCVEQTQAGDQPFAVSYMSGAVVCSSGSNLVMFMQFNEGGLSPAIPVREIARAGATAYTTEANQTSFSLVRKMVSPSVKANGAFSIGMNGMTATRSLRCN